MDPDTGRGGFPLRFRLQATPRPETELPAVRSSALATPDYFQTLGIPLVAGTNFSRRRHAMVAP